MPLPPATRRERYKAKKEDALEANPPQKVKRRRCRNCGSFTPLNRPNKIFCSEECGREFRRHGSAFGPLKFQLEKLVRAWMKSYQQDMDANFIRLQKRVDALERDGLPAEQSRMLDKAVDGALKQLGKR
jgi:hypothetical protein